ncbi:AMSH-like protease sst2 [Tolypocladium ophioglossoides CBS 100239]|uniref:AMSH-like protease sst2 n=1 Tax=Tolypocladium ophioglossoides (strain CBS 100239) TaxID=1163406 RepID=A0A0L0N5E6_TOLOC|nr:AMSH-like protease sst2 [Tolypocladium ophioglossoides CBS 100239]
MEPRSSARPTRPQTVSSLVAQAENFSFNTNIEFKYWARAAETLHQEASFALADGDYGRAYMMLYRHSVLVLNCLPKHPKFKDPDSREAFKPLAKRIDSVLDHLEHIKPVVEDEYEEWERMSSSAKSSLREHQKAPSSYAAFAARDPSLGGRAKVLDASEHQELAVDLAQKELARRDQARRESRASRKSDQQAHGDGRFRAPGDDDLQRQMEAARRFLSRDQQVGGDERIRDRKSAHAVIPAHYNYPSIAKPKPVAYAGSQRQPQPPSMPTPSRPPKEGLPSPAKDDAPVRFPNPGALMPAIPRKIPLDDYAPLVPTPPSVATGQPLLPPKGPLDGPLDGPPLPRKERLAFKPGGYLENGDPIRSVFLPSSLRSMFLDIASKNTRAGLEMCGILCGTPVNNALFVRCLLIPDQKCTSDTCETENEGAIFDYCASEDLLVLGWIHTHPTQTCFMSSRDLHTHAGYQVMMPESIAIVCAPRFKPSYGIFRLTHPPGLDHILDCRHHDTFHQHSIDNIYRETEHPHGHVYESDKMPFYVQDLRRR